MFLISLFLKGALISQKSSNCSDKAAGQILAHISMNSPFIQGKGFGLTKLHLLEKIVCLKCQSSRFQTSRFPAKLDVMFTKNALLCCYL